MKVWRARIGGETIHPDGCEAAACSGDGVNGYDNTHNVVEEAYSPARP